MDWEADYGVGECDSCDKSEVRVIFDSSPYTREVNPEMENPERNWCFDCYENNLGDI